MSLRTVEVGRDLWRLCSAQPCLAGSARAGLQCLALPSPVWLSLFWVPSAPGTSASVWHAGLSVLAANTWRWIAFIFHSYRLLLQPFFLVGKVQVWSCSVCGSRGSEKGGGRWDWAEWGSSCPSGVWRAADAMTSWSKGHWGGSSWLAYRRDNEGKKSLLSWLTLFSEGLIIV